jgi:thymidylate synthase
MSGPSRPVEELPPSRSGDDRSDIFALPTFSTFHDVYRSALASVRNRYRYLNAPRGFSSRERLCVSFELTQPVQRIPVIPSRRTNIVFGFAEALWYYAARNDLEFMAYYAPRIRKYSSDGARLTGTAYGPRIARVDSDGLS